MPVSGIIVVNDTTNANYVRSRVSILYVSSRKKCDLNLNLEKDSKLFLHGSTEDGLTRSSSTKKVVRKAVAAKVTKSSCRKYL